MTNSSCTYSAYLVSTGEVTGKRITATTEILALNTAPGEAWIEGEADHRRQRVAQVTDDFGDQVAVLVDWQPPAPEATEWRTWSWAVGQRAWLAVPTLKYLQHQAAAPLLLQLDELDSKARRPTEEITEAVAVGEPVPTEALERLQSIRAEKDALRQQLAAIAASTSEAELASITASTTQP